jgi:cell wall-associated NlpC family hydrolase
MRTPSQPAIGALLVGLAMSVCWAQQSPRSSGAANPVAPGGSGKHAARANRTLSQDDGLSVIAAALDSRVRRYSGNDCSHLVHAIYERAGFPYAYASSDDLYVGVEAFQRVPRPQPGDLVVWRGHVGIVVRPSRHVFFSFKSNGPGVDDYETPYWLGRGRARFYRYVKNDRCPGCAAVGKSSPRSDK